LIPLVYIKLIPVIPWATLGLFTSIFYAVFWFLGGLFISLFLAMRDVAYFLLILSMHNGCRENEPDEDEIDENADDTRERVMNEVRTEVIKYYYEIKKAIAGGIQTQEEAEEEKKTDYEKINVIEMLDEDLKNFEENSDDEDPTVAGDEAGKEKKKVKWERNMFIVKMTEIQDQWRKGKSKNVAQKEKNEEELQKEADAAKAKAEAEAEREKNASTVKGKMMQEFNTKVGGKTEAFIKEIVGNLAQEEEHEQQTDAEEEAEEDLMLDVEDEQDAFCAAFLEKFLIGSESAFLDNIDIILMLRALPIPIMRKNRDKVRMFNFNILQGALIAYSTAEKVQAFEFYDKLNRSRVQNVKDIILK
jgi:hypothetical protein